jgi:hypothetical protein
MVDADIVLKFSEREREFCLLELVYGQKVMAAGPDHDIYLDSRTDIYINGSNVNTGTIYSGNRNLCVE